MPYMESGTNILSYDELTMTGPRSETPELAQLAACGERCPAPRRVGCVSPSALFIRRARRSWPSTTPDTHAGCRDGPPTASKNCAGRLSRAGARRAFAPARSGVVASSTAPARRRSTRRRRCRPASARRCCRRRRTASSTPSACRAAMWRIRLLPRDAARSAPSPRNFEPRDFQVRPSPARPPPARRPPARARRRRSVPLLRQGKPLDAGCATRRRARAAPPLRRPRSRCSPISISSPMSRRRRRCTRSAPTRRRRWRRRSA